MKSVDSTCPNPFNEPERFSVYFAQKSISVNSLSDEFEDDIVISISKPEPSSVVLNEDQSQSVDFENALLRLQNLRMEEQRGFQIERENFETRFGQFTLLQQEIELLRKQNSEHEIQIEFLKSQNNISQSDFEVESLRTQLLMTNEKHFAEIEVLNSQNNSKEIKLTETIEKLKKDLENIRETENIKIQQEEHIEELKKTNNQLKVQLEGQEEKERQFREVSEENVRLKIDFDDLKRELTETRTQLTDLEVINFNNNFLLFFILEGAYFVNVNYFRRRKNTIVR